MQLNQIIILTILYFNSPYFLRNYLCLDLYLPTLTRIIIVLLSIWNRVSLRKGNKISFVVRCLHLGWPHSSLFRLKNRLTLCSSFV